MPESRVDAAIAEFLQAAEAGAPMEREAWLARYPDLRPQLEEFLKDRSAFKRAAEPIDHDKTMAPREEDSVADLLTVRYFGDYELQQEIARGGMGVVWKARQVSLNRPVALKMILAGQLASPADVQRFRTEAEAAANLDHPNILPIYEVGEHEGQQYFSMKLIDGGSLADAIKAKSLSERQGVELLAKVCRAVQFAHQRGILHRDLKPANILLEQAGTPYVTDFGLAKKVEGDSALTQTGAIVGTPSYMAPEQARAEKSLSTAVDVYAIGAILYEFLTGRPPFQAPTTLDTIMQVLEQEPKPPHTLNPKIGRDLETICLKCLEKEPGRRYASAAELAQDLDRFLEGDAVKARPLGERESAVRWAKKHPITAALTILFTMVALFVQIFYTAASFGVPFGGAKGEGPFIILAFAAWLAGFLSAMAILVHPRRWVILGAVSFLLIALGLPCVAQEYLNARPFKDNLSGVPGSLLVALGLVVGVFLAGVYGGMSRWISRRREIDMLSVFFGGVLGAICAWFFTGCLVAFPVMYVLDRRGVDERGAGLFLAIGAMYLCMFICSVVGFWLGGTFTARFIQRRLRPT
jgi:hypothetical protein